MRTQRGRELDEECRQQGSATAFPAALAGRCLPRSACMGQSNACEHWRPYPAMPPPDDECRCCWRGSCWKDTLGRVDMASAL